jgi:uncharacterized membrane protein
MDIGMAVRVWRRILVALFAVGLHAANELVEACLADTNPGAFVDLTRPHTQHSVRGHRLRHAVPGNWWTWIVQLLLPNQGPAATSFVTVEEALAILTVSLLAQLLGRTGAIGTQGNWRIERYRHRALLASGEPLTPGRNHAMSAVQRAVEIAVPVHTAYEQLARCESYPRFMTGVHEVTQVSDNTTHWVMDMGGQRLEFNARITECAMDERVAWRALDGPAIAETITLKPMSANRTKVIADLDADVLALMPSDLHARETLSKRLAMDLDRFKDYLEHRPGA